MTEAPSPSALAPSRHEASLMQEVVVLREVLDRFLERLVAAGESGEVIAVAVAAGATLNELRGVVEFLL